MTQEEQIIKLLETAKKEKRLLPMSEIIKTLWPTQPPGDPKSAVRKLMSRLRTERSYNIERTLGYKWHA